MQLFQIIFRQLKYRMISISQFISISVANMEMARQVVFYMISDQIASLMDVMHNISSYLYLVVY